MNHLPVMIANLKSMISRVTLVNPPLLSIETLTLILNLSIKIFKIYILHTSYIIYQSIKRNINFS